MRSIKRRNLSLVRVTVSLMTTEQLIGQFRSAVKNPEAIT